MWGTSECIAPKTLLVMTISRIADVATTLAVRLSDSTSAISPKKSPGPRVVMRFRPA